MTVYLLLWFHIYDSQPCAFYSLCFLLFDGIPVLFLFMGLEKLLKRISCIKNLPNKYWSLMEIAATIFNKNLKPIAADPSGRRGNAFDYGSGFVSPGSWSHLWRSKQRIINLLCSIVYDEKSLHLVPRENSTCNQILTTASSLTYPPITIPNLKDDFSVTLTVTNVGKSGSIYKAIEFNPVGINVTVVPKPLVSTATYGQKIKFTASFKVAPQSKGYCIWVFDREEFASSSMG